MRLVVGHAGALQLDVEAVRNRHASAQRELAGALLVALQPAPGPTGPACGAGQRDQAGAELAQPFDRSTACARTTLRVQARASSSHRLR